MLDINRFIAAYEGGNTAPYGTEEIISALKDHSYRFNVEGGLLRDKLVLKVMETILIEIFEPTFCNSSHGFRANRGYHSCLRSIKYGWKGTKWFIEGDISNYFDYHIPSNIMMEKVQDREFIDLYWKAVRANYVSLRGEKGFKGVREGSSLSGIISNIYLHNLDLFMEEKIKESNKSGPVSLGRGFRIKYVRYGDGFLIGIKGNEDLCLQLKEEISQFLYKELGLILKTKIKSAIKGRANFLGSEICVRARDGHIVLLAPLEKLVHKLKDQGMCRVVDFRQRKIIPTRKTDWRNLDLVSIVTKYGMVWRDILNYYSFADNRSQLNLIQFILHHSCACTMGDKQRLKSRAKVFRKWGVDLEVEKGIRFPIQKSLRKICSFNRKI